MTHDEAAHLFYAEDALKRAKERWDATMREIAEHIRQVAFEGIQKDEALIRKAEEAARVLDICEFAAKIARERGRESDHGA